MSTGLYVFCVVFLLLFAAGLAEIVARAEFARHRLERSRRLGEEEESK